MEPPPKINTPRAFFLDSGAHSLYNTHVRAKSTHRSKDYSFYKTKQFWDYVDGYAEFVKKRRSSIDYYANVDVIYNPKLSWKVLKYLENEHGLNPVPVIHNATPLKWVEKHINAGYTFIGLGGLGQDSLGEYSQWGDAVFDLICDNEDRLPSVRVHGFAMSSYKLLWRYPWWSTDSSSWVKAAAYGNLFIPHMRKGKFTFSEQPYMICMTPDHPGRIIGNSKHYSRCSPAERIVIQAWLDAIGVPLGVDEWGVVTEHAARKEANIRYFEEMCKAMPKWPWSFRRRRKCSGGFGL